VTARGQRQVFASWIDRRPQPEVAYGSAKRTHGRCPGGQTTGTSDKARAGVFEQLRRVIAWEVEAQVGVERSLEKMPSLIADTVLDYFDVSLKAGADISHL
jgi:hypothetical protein